jgi:hypothetical protein
MSLRCVEFIHLTPSPARHSFTAMNAQETHARLR